MSLLEIQKIILRILTYARSDCSSKNLKKTQKRDLTHTKRDENLHNAHIETVRAISAAHLVLIRGNRQQGKKMKTLDSEMISR